MLWYKFTSICKYLSFFTPPLVGVVEYYDERVCLCVCLHNHISGTTDLIFTKFFVHVTYVCGLGLLWRRSLPCWTSYFEGSFTSWLLYWPCLTVSTKEQSGVFLVLFFKKIINAVVTACAFGALTLFVGRQEEHPACNNWVMRCWCGYLSGARCRLFAYGPADATAIPKPRHLLPHLNPDWFYFSGTVLPRLSWKRVREMGSVTAVVVVVTAYAPSDLPGTTPMVNAASICFIPAL